MPVQSRKAAKYIRVVVPTDLRSRLGRGEIVRSLRCQSQSEARVRGPAIEGAIRLALRQARVRRMDRDELDRLVDRYVAEAFARIEAEVAVETTEAAREELALQTADEAHVAEAQMSAGDYSAVRELAAELLAGNESSREDRLLLEARLMRAAQSLRLKKLDLLNGRVPRVDTERPYSGSLRLVGKATTGPLLSVAVSRYASFKTAQGAWTDKSAQLFKALLQELVEIVGDRELSTLTKADLLRYYEALPKLPSNAAKKWPGLDARAVLDATAALDVDRLAPKSINKRLSLVKSFLGWAVDADLLSANLGTILKPVPEGDAREARLPLSDAEVRAFLAKCDEEARDDAHRLVPLLCAYSGLRLNEAAQLDRDDIREVEGVWVCDINGEGDKILKTPTAKRLVPIHSSILPSILAHREAVRQGNLWGIQKGRDGHSGPLSKWFARRLDAVVDHDRKTFHSLRHSVATKLKGQGVEEYLIEGLLGHTSRSMSTGRYGKAAPVETMRRLVERIEYRIESEA